MAKRSETIKCNCPACGTGLHVDLDDLDVMAIGDNIKKPEKSAEGGNSVSESGNGEQKNSAESTGAESGQAASSEDQSGGGGDGSSTESSKKDQSDIGDW